MKCVSKIPQAYDSQSSRQCQGFQELMADGRLADKHVVALLDPTVDTCAGNNVIVFILVR